MSSIAKWIWHAKSNHSIRKRILSAIPIWCTSGAEDDDLFPSLPPPSMPICVNTGGWQIGVKRVDGCCCCRGSIKLHASSTRRSAEPRAEMNQSSISSWIDRFVNSGQLSSSQSSLSTAWLPFFTFHSAYTFHWNWQKWYCQRTTTVLIIIKLWDQDNAGWLVHLYARCHWHTESRWCSRMKSNQKLCGCRSGR